MPTLEELQQELNRRRQLDEAKKELVIRREQNIKQPVELEPSGRSVLGYEVPESTGPGAEPLDLPVGALVGGTIGGVLGSPGGPATAIPLAGVGAAGGEAVEQLARRALGYEAPKTSVEAAKRIGIEGAKGLAGEAGGRLVVGAVGKVLSFAPMAKKVTPEAQRAIDFLRSRLKQPLLPAEATESRLLDILENIAESSLVGGTRITRFKLERTKILDGISDDIIKSFGAKAEPDQVGELFVKTIEERIKPSRTASKILYDTVEGMTAPTIKKEFVAGEFERVGEVVERAVGGINISTKNLKSFVKPLKQIAADLNSIEAKNAGDDLVSAIMEIPDEIPFSVANELRARLISRINEFNVINKKAPAIGKAKKLISLIDNAMERTLKEQNPMALRMWREANRLYKEGSEQFDNNFVRRLVKMADPKMGGSPEDIVKAIFKPGAVTNIRRAKNALGQFPWNKLKSYYTQYIVSKSTSPSGELLGLNMEANLFGKAGMGEETLREIYNPQEFRTIKEFANALKVSQAKGAEGAGRIFIQLTQAGAAVSLSTGRFTRQALSVIFAPPLISRIFTNPTAMKYLTQGLKLPANSPLLGGIFGRFVASVAQIKEEKRKEEPIAKPGAVSFQ